MVWYFIGVYTINRTLHGRLEIRNFPSRFEKYFTTRREIWQSARVHVMSSMTLDAIAVFFSRLGYGSLHIDSCKGIQDSLGFLDPTPWIPDSRYWNWILDSNYSRDSGFRKLSSRSQSSGSRIPQAKISWIPESGFPTMSFKPGFLQLEHWVLGLFTQLSTN